MGGLERTGALQTLIQRAVAHASSGGGHTQRERAHGSFLGHVRLLFVDEERWAQQQAKASTQHELLFADAAADDAWDSCSAHAAAEHTLRAVLPLHALPVHDPSGALPPGVAAAAVEGSAELSAAAAKLLEALGTLRAAFVPAATPAQFAELTQLHSFYSAAGDELDAPRIAPAEAAAVRGVEALLAPVVAHLKQRVAAPLLGCATSELLCPRRTWYARLHGAAQNRSS